MFRQQDKKLFSIAIHQALLPIVGAYQVRRHCFEKWDDLKPKEEEDESWKKQLL